MVKHLGFLLFSVFLVSERVSGFSSVSLLCNSRVSGAFSRTSSIRNAPFQVTKRYLRFSNSPCRMQHDTNPLFKELRAQLKSSNVWLVGMDGCQKEAVGDFLARQMGYRYINTNSIIEQLVKVPIASALTATGEDSYVKLERAVLDQVQAYVRAVISTGSCAPLDIENWAKLRTGLVVYMDAAAGDLQAEGLQSPLAREAASLLNLPEADRLGALVEQRASMYSQADVTVPIAASESPAEIAGAVALALRKHILEHAAPQNPTLSDAHAKAIAREMGMKDAIITNDGDRSGGG